MIPWKTLFYFNWVMSLLNIYVGAWTRSAFNITVGLFCSAASVYAYFKMREEEDVRSED